MPINWTRDRGFPNLVTKKSLMSVETEKKYKLKRKRLEEILARLTELGAEFEKEVFEINYQHRGGAMDERDATLRLRKIDNFAVLTYKEPIFSDDGTKQRVEYETTVANVDAMEKIIQALGYRLTAVYEKRRKYWRLDDVEVVMDELPFGLYMEIEGTPESIGAAERKLGLQELEHEPRGYPRLTIKKGEMIDGVAIARFERSVAG